MLERERSKIDLNVDLKEAPETFALSSGQVVRPDQSSTSLTDQALSEVDDQITQATSAAKAPKDRAKNKSDPLEQLFAKTKSPPSLLFLLVGFVSAWLGFPLTRLDDPVFKTLGVLILFAISLYSLKTNLRMQSASMLADEEDELNPLNLLTANICLCVFAAASLTFEHNQWSIIFAGFMTAAIAISSAVQTVYLSRFVKAFAPDLFPKTRLLIRILPLVGNSLGLYFYQPLLLISQLAILGVEALLLRRLTRKSAGILVAAEDCHSSHILLPYQSSNTERMFTSRVLALRKRPSLILAALGCCAALTACISWFFNKFVNEPPPIAQTKISAVIPGNFALPPVHAGPDAFQIIILGAIALVLYLVIRTTLSHPSFVYFGSTGIRLIYTRLWTRQGKLLSWDNVQNIRVEGSTSRSKARSIIFAGRGSLTLKLKLSCIGNAIDRKLMLNAIRQWGRLVPRDPAVEEILEVPSSHSYTELWLQSLAAPPKRERLKPLIAGALLQEGAFEVVRPLGSGGQGFAYLVWDTINNQEVVLKEFILPTFVSSTVRMRALEAFENEARILKSLDHDQIVRLRDYFVEDHRAYLVLDFLKGVTLKDLVRERGALDENTTLVLAKKMCDILVYLHGLKPPVIHRDFTPDNLIYDLKGSLTLIDFNVAQEDQQGTTGNIVGKHAYVPPEQFQGQARTTSDIYAFGATLYYLLTGVDPQPITTSVLSEMLPSISPDLDRLVRVATALDPAQRYQTAPDLLKDICAQIENRKLNLNSNFSPLIEVALSTGTADLETGRILRGETPEELEVKAPEQIKTAVTKTNTKTQKQPYLPIASVAIIILSLFSFAWLKVRPFQELLAPELKKVHANIDFGEQLSSVYQDWYRLRNKLAENRATQLIAEYGSNPYISKDYLSRLYEEKAYILLQENQTRQAIDFASKALALGPSITAFNLRASAYYRLMDLTKARSDCNDALLQKVDHLKPKGTVDLPLDHFDKISYSNFLRATCELLLGNANQSLQFFSSVRAPLSPKGLLIRGLAKEFEGDFMGATEDLTRYDETEKQYGTAECRYAECELERLSNYRAAKEISIQQGTKFQQNEFWQVRKAVIQQQNATVVGLCTKYLQRHPNTLEYMIDQANALAELKDSNKAAQMLTLVNELSPQNQEAQWGLAELCLERGDDPKALNLFKSLSESAPRAEYFVRMAEILTKQRQYTSALTCYEKALKLAPTWKIARSGHGGVLVLLGRYEEAAREIHGIEFDGTEVHEYAQGLYRLAKARHALKQYSAEEWNLQAIKDTGLTPTDD